MMLMKAAISQTTTPSADQSSALEGMRTALSRARPWNTTETTPVIAAPSPSPRAVRRLFSATCSGVGGGTTNTGAGAYGGAPPYGGVPGRAGPMPYGDGVGPAPCADVG